MEVRYLAIVQIGGTLGRDITRSEGFTEYADAVRWVRDMVEDAHGGIGHVVPSLAKFTYDFGGEPHTVRQAITKIITPDGPVNGFVIDLGIVDAKTDEIHLTDEIPF